MKTCFFIAFVMLGMGLNGQTRPEHKSKFYKSDDGKLYINKDIPLYLHISDAKEPGDGNSFLLESQSSPEYSSPFFLDTEGWNTIRTPSKVDPETRKVILPISDVIFEVYADGLPPVSKIHYKEAPLHSVNGKLFIGKGLEIKLTASDKTSGLQQTLYSINDTPFEKYVAPLKFDKEESYNLKVYSVDNVGNVENDIIFNFIPDYSAPNTTMELSKDYTGTILSPRTIINLSAKDNLSGVKNILFNYSDGKNNFYNNLISPGWIGEGEHKLVYYSQDFVANIETKNIFTFYMDKSAPEVTYEIVGDDYERGQRRFISARTRIRLKAIDNKAGVKEVYYSLNGKKPILYTEPFLLDVKAITLNLRYYAIDNVNNSNKNEAYAGGGSLNLNLVRDEDPPIISLDYAYPNITVNKMLYLRETSQISIVATDGLSGVQQISYSLDNLEHAYETPFFVKEEGKHKITYRATDNSNNERVESIDFYVDNTGPELNIQFGIGAIGQDTISGAEVNVYPPKTGVFITATDQLVGYDKIFYSINGAAEIESKGVIKNLKVGEYKLVVRGLDKLGNSNTKQVSFIVRKDL